MARPGQVRKPRWKKPHQRRHRQSEPKSNPRAVANSSSNGRSSTPKNREPIYPHMPRRSDFSERRRRENSIQYRELNDWLKDPRSDPPRSVPNTAKGSIWEPTESDIERLKRDIAVGLLPENLKRDNVEGQFGDSKEFIWEPTESDIERLKRDIAAGLLPENA